MARTVTFKEMNGLFALLIRHEYFADVRMLYRVICRCLSAATSANYQLQHPHICISAFYPRPFSWRCVAGFVGGAIFLHYPAIALPVCWCSCTQLSSENTIDRNSIVLTLSLKEGFLWVIYKKKGLGLLGHSREKETIEYV